MSTYAATHDFYPSGVCHDCRRPSNTYRCPKCKAIFIEKHKHEYGLSYNEGSDLPDLYHIFKDIRRNKLFR